MFGVLPATHSFITCFKLQEVLPVTLWPRARKQALSDSLERLCSKDPKAIDGVYLSLPNIFPVWIERISF